MYDAGQNDPELCCRLLEVARRCDFSDAQLAVISAGPFEELMGHHGMEFLQRIKAAARQDAKMRYLLATIWQGGMSDEVWSQVLQIRSALGISPL